MTSPEILYTYELSGHDADIESLHAAAFGPARHTRAACFVRRGGPHDLSLSFVAIAGKQLIGSVRMTPVVIGAAKALLLGPLVVHSGYKNTGVGSKLMKKALDAARQAGHQLVILIGDEPYYQRFGFRRICAGQVVMPAPVNPARLLCCELITGALQKANGIVRHASLSADSATDQRKPHNRKGSIRARLKRHKAKGK